MTTYKNWDRICDIKDPLLRIAIGTLDTNTDVGGRIAAAVPEYFSEEPDTGPIPWSIIEQVTIEQGMSLPEAAVTLRIPVIVVTKGNTPGANLRFNFLKDIPVGGHAIWNNAFMAVLENNGEQVTLAPVARIAPYR